MQVSRNAQPLSRHGQSSDLSPRSAQLDARCNCPNHAHHNNADHSDHGDRCRDIIPVGVREPNTHMLSLIKSYPWKILARLTKPYRSSCWHTHLASKPLAKKATLIDRLARLASPPVPPSVPLSLSLGLALAQALHFLQGDR